jgi:lysozyme
MTIRTWASVQSAQGLDVSNFQGNFSWSAAIKDYPGLHFGIHRLTQGLGQSGTNSPDPTAAWNHAQIAACGLRRGAYHFLDPFQDGAAQARYFLAMAGRLGITEADILVCDNETAGTSPAATAACCDAFMTELVAQRPANPRLVYTYIDFAKQGNCAGAGKWPLWLAYPNNTAPAAPPPWVNWTFWQWGTRGGDDADAFNGTAAQMDAWIASFAPAPGGPYKHLTDGATSITSYAASRNMKPVAWLAAQDKITGTDTHSGALCEAVPRAGLPWWSENP